jgi:hypothetical protein
MNSLRATHHTLPSPVKPVLRFARHFFEMCIAMCVGFAIGDAIYFLVAGAFGYDKPFNDLPVLSLFVVTFNMTVPMVLWMRYRGHSWERGGEMAIAMNLPLLPLLLLYSRDLIPAQAVLGLQMMLMIPAMVLAMLYRKDEYSASHQTARHPHRRWFAGAH